MADYISNVVETTLVMGTTVIDTRSFDVPMILTSHFVTGDRANTYSSYDAILEAGFSSDSPAAKMASLLFSGVAKPSKVVIGRRALDKIVVNLTGTVAEGVTYTIKLSSGNKTKLFTYTAAALDDAADVVGALDTAIAGDATWNAIADATVAGNTLEITPKTGMYVDAGAVANTSISRTVTEDIDTAVAAVSQANSKYFWVLSDSHTDTDVKALAAYAETSDRIYCFSSQDSDIKGAVDGNTLQDLVDLGRANTWFGLWTNDADSTFPEAGCVGAIANTYPGTTTMHGKTLSGVVSNSATLNETDFTKIIQNNGNIYKTEMGVNFYRDGRMVNGDYVDTRHFALWSKARTSEAVFGLFKRRSDSLSKVAFDSAGFSAIRGAIYNGVIQVAINRKAIMNEIVQDSSGNNHDLRPVITIPSRGDIPDNDIANRILNDVVVEMVYNSPIHYVKIKVGIVLNR